MQAFRDIAKPPKFKSKMVKEEKDLKCEKCGRTYDYYEFKKQDGSIQIVKFGCDCEMKEFARQSTQNYHKKQKRIKAEKIFKQSIINQSLANATFDNYKIDENTQLQLAKAKWICKKYADSFNLDNKQSLLIQGSFGTGKSHLSMSIVK
ncbi:DNA replication protein DnaC, partial [Paraburkholderia tropica]